MTTTFTYQEALGVLALLLEQCQEGRAHLRLSPQGAEAAAPGWRWPRECTPDMLREEAARQARDRSQPRYEHHRADRLSACLRVMGGAWTSSASASSSSPCCPRRYTCRARVAASRWSRWTR